MKSSVCIYHFEKNLQGFAFFVRQNTGIFGEKEKKRELRGDNPLEFFSRKKEKSTCNCKCFLWRRERDSNSRYGITAHTISSRAP